jgi:hypothetical protein
LPLLSSQAVSSRLYLVLRNVARPTTMDLKKASAEVETKRSVATHHEKYA